MAALVATGVGVFFDALYACLLGLGPPARHPVVVGHPDARLSLHDGELAGRHELVGEACKSCRLRVALPVGGEHPQRVFLRFPAPVPAGPVERGRHGPLLLAELDHHAD